MLHISTDSNITVMQETKDMTTVTLYMKGSTDMQGQQTWL